MVYKYIKKQIKYTKEIIYMKYANILAFTTIFNAMQLIVNVKSEKWFSNEYMYENKIYAQKYW